MPNKTYAFEKLEIWKLGRSFKLRVYKVSSQFPSEEKYQLTSQLRRAASSITANIAEGAGRATKKDRASFTNNAYASGLETVDHLITAFDLGYLSEEYYESLRKEIDEILEKLNKYYFYQLKHGKNLDELLK